MFFFRRKTKRGQEAAEKPEAKEDSVQFPGRFRSVCPEPQGETLGVYVEPARKLGQMLRDLDAGEGGLQRLRWQLEVATEAITMIGKRPLQAIIPLHADNVWDWHRAVYLRGLVAGIGNYLRSGAVITQASKDLHPAIQGWPDGVMQYVPNRPIKQEFKISPSIAEYRVAEQAGIISLAEKLHPGVFGYFCDSFGADAWGRNPISISIAEAEVKVTRILNLDGIRTHGVARLSKSHTKITVSQDEEQVATSAGTASSVAQDDGPSIPGDGPEVKFNNEGLGPSNHNAMVEFICQRLIQGVITINEHDSVFCQVQGRLALVCPKGIAILAQMTGLESTDLKSILMSMADPDLSTPKMEYRIQRKGRGWGKIRLLVLKEVYGQRLLSVATKVQEPPAIRSKALAETSEASPKHDSNE